LILETGFFKKMSCKKKIKLETLRTSQALVSTDPSVESRSTSHQLESLSDETLLKIFSFVSQQDRGRLASVCSRFKRLAMDHTLWKKVREGLKFFLIILCLLYL
jgi:hypothetical protein